MVGFAIGLLVIAAALLWQFGRLIIAGVRWLFS